MEFDEIYSKIYCPIANKILEKNLYTVVAQQWGNLQKNFEENLGWCILDILGLIVKIEISTIINVLIAQYNYALWNYQVFSR